ncbi:MAG: hypothetical protein OXG25_00050, partial [Gammaproteobacteria bacterium]|nr:hypothetical protein [Gammaproteobacteria bacterium]
SPEVSTVHPLSDGVLISLIFTTPELRQSSGDDFAARQHRHHRRDGRANDGAVDGLVGAFGKSAIGCIGINPSIIVAAESVEP